MADESTYAYLQYIYDRWSKLTYKMVILQQVTKPVALQIEWFPWCEAARPWGHSLSLLYSITEGEFWCHSTLPPSLWPCDSLLNVLEHRIIISLLKVYLKIQLCNAFVFTARNVRQSSRVSCMQANIRPMLCGLLRDPLDSWFLSSMLSVVDASNFKRYTPWGKNMAGPIFKRY